MTAPVSGDIADPSTLLAVALARMDGALSKDPTLCPAMIAIADDTRRRSDAIWEVDADTLYESLGHNPDDFAGDMAPELLARWIGGLDAWHRFANPATMNLGDAIFPPAAQDAEARLERDGAYNNQRDDAIGLLIPRVCADAPGAAYTSRTPLLAEYETYREASIQNGGHLNSYDEFPAPDGPAGANALLQNCVWLPRSLDCGHPDGTIHPLRQVLAGYAPIGADRKSEPLPLDDDLTISVAPLAETADCVEMVVTDHGTRYLVAPIFSIQRVKAAILRAFADGSHMLLFPEMTIDSSWLDDLANFVRTTRRANRDACLRYILLGTTTRPADGRSGRNFVSVIDGTGSLVQRPLTGGAAQQDKISRWNLSVSDQRRFGFDRRPNTLPPLAPLVTESIVEAETVFIFDILGFGRLVCLICASLDHNQPIDWVIRNARPDWIYAPVMDSSTGLGARGTSPMAKWTVRRAIRAACLSRGRVIVSNSMALQQFENRENGLSNMPDGTQKAGPAYAPDSQPGLALMIDGRGDDLRHDVLASAIPDQANETHPIMVTATWGQNWTKLPPII